MPYDPHYQVTITLDAKGFSGAHVEDALDQVAELLDALDIRIVDFTVDEPQWRALSDPLAWVGPSVD